MRAEEYEARLQAYITERAIRAEQLVFQQSTHSVAKAAAAAGVTPQDFIKNICLITAAGELVVAIVKGEDKVSAVKVGHLLGVPTPRMAKADEILARTGYPCGGTPSFGFPARFLMDPRVFELALVYTGGGSETALVRADPAELRRANGAQVAEIRG